MILAVIIVMAGVFFFIYEIKDGSDSTCVIPNGCKVEGIEEINNFDDCVAAGYPMAESYPRQCRTKNGLLFTEDVGNELEKTDLIRIDSPRPNQTVSSPLTVRGEARGYWFFEASFPVELLNEDNNVIAQGIATAKNDWMTEDFVPFEAVLEFKKPSTKQGTLVLKKDNPSGLPENDDRLYLPLTFNQ